MDSYRVEAKAAMAIVLTDADAEIGPVPASGGGRKPEIDLLSNILKTFNELFGNIEWSGKTRIKLGRLSRRSFLRRFRPTEPIITR